MMHISTPPYTLENRIALPKSKPASKKDYHIILFFWNVAIVIIGYGLANPTGFASVAPMKILRILLLTFSLIYLFKGTKEYNYIFAGKSSWVIWIFMASNIYIMPFSFNITESLEKFINLVPYFIYINYFIVYLNRRYNKQEILNMLLDMFNIVYVIPLFSFVFLGGSFSQENIYGEVIGGFVSNHYGWSSAVFLSTSIDLLRNYSTLSKVRKIFILFSFILSCYVLVISGSRSGYLTFSLCFLLFIVRNTNSSLFIKLASIIIVTFFVLQLYGNENSALNKRLKKTETQLEEGDARNSIYKLCFQTMADNPFTMVTGFGFYAFQEALLNLDKEISADQIVNLHNSYYELLFGSGIFVFTFFIVTFIFKTLLSFFRNHSSQYIFLPPLILIPFFENNFNPGQFLFFPWFTIMFYYIHYGERQKIIHASAPRRTDGFQQQVTISYQ